MSYLARSLQKAFRESRPEGWACDAEISRAQHAKQPHPPDTLTKL